MPGVVGLHVQTALPDGSSLLSAMSHALEPGEGYKHNLEFRNGTGLGLVHLASTDDDGQPSWNEDRTCWAVMTGELFDTEGIKSGLIAQGHQFRSDSEAEFLLHLYEQEGLRFPEQLNGAFAAAIWDGSNQRLLLATDHLGQHPLYYCQHGDGMYFASGVRALLAVPGIQTKIELEPVVQFLSLGHLLGDRTYLEEVKLLTPGSILVFSQGKPSVKRYWQLVYPQQYTLCDQEEIVPELVSHLRRAVARQVRTQDEPGIFLSGGVDSRLLLGLLSEQVSPSRIHTFTWGIPGCDDVRYARQVSASIGAQNTFIPLSPEVIQRSCPQAIRATDGFANLVNMHIFAVLPQVARHAQVLYKGFLGDALSGHYVNQMMLTMASDDDLIDYLLRRDVNFYPVVFTPEEIESLLSNPARKQIDPAGHLLGMLKTYLAESEARMAADRINHFDILQRQRRLTQNGVELARTLALVRTPYCDRELVEFMTHICPGYRFERYLQKQIIVQYFPHLSTIPVAGSGLPLRDSARKLIRKANEFVRWHLHMHGLLGNPLIKNRPYADYNGWFREELRAFTEQILLDKRTLERGIFDPQAIKRLVDDHMNGGNHDVKIGGLLSLELMQRVLLDEAEQYPVPEPA